MTDDTGGAARLPARIAADEKAIDGTLDRLLNAAEAARLMIGVAKIIPDTAGHKLGASPEMFEIWRASNLLVQTAFDNLLTEVISADAYLRPSSPLYSG